VSFFGRTERPLVVGHRGGQGDGWPPENTLQAFECARSKGAHGVETDLRLCASGEVVALHDPTLLRMTGGADARAAAALTLTELSAVGLAGTTHHVPRLQAILAWAGEHGMLLNVEIKHDVPKRLPLVMAVARDLRASPRVPVLVSSFDPITIALTAAVLPHLPRALLTDPGQRYAPVLYALARAPAVSAIHAHRSQVTPDRVRRWKARGLRVGVWTVNDPAEARALAGMGVDLLVTDDSGAVCAALR
jgi:glycerophosphoryl diester phosphodiesterase